MTPERWQIIQDLLTTLTAVESSEERARLLAEATAGDEELSKEVRELLALEDEAEDFITEPLWNLLHAADGDPVSAVPQRIGPYRVSELLGRGGMGDVFLAVREDDYRQRVALKVLGRGAGRDDLLERFYKERQILANLQHPNIAHLLDGGALEDGRPYFVMEYVEGEPIDHFCASQRLSLSRRIVLFQQVCQVVHYAHQNLVVHRDLKASNILVTPEGEPRLLDFGIAKLLQTTAVESSELTATGLVPMTPANASPEQLLNEPITTACDVYALGVLLYRLLTGRRPYNLDGMSFAEMVRQVCQLDPPLPSEKAGHATARPDESALVVPEDSERLRRQLLGDLDAIVMKAVRKETDQRYGSALELAEDLRRYLEGLPVSARQGNWLYNSRKFVRRNKPALFVMLLIVAFSINTTYLWLTAREERTQAVLERARAEAAQEKAEHSQKTAEAVTDFLTELFHSADPHTTGTAELSVSEMLERGRHRVETELSGEPELQAELLGTLGTVYNNRGLYEEAFDLKVRALETWQAEHPEDGPEHVHLLNNLARWLYDTGDYLKAESYFREALAMRRRLGQEPLEIAVTLTNLAATLAQMNRDEAESLHLQVLEIRRTSPGDNQAAIATSLYSLGAFYMYRGNYSRAEPLFHQALELRSELYGRQSTQAASLLNSLGRVSHGLNRLEEARSSYEEALQIRLTLLGSEHPKVAKTEKNLAAVLLELGEIKAAAPLAEHAVTALRSSHPPGDWLIADAESVLGAVRLAAGDFEAAEPLLLRSHEVIRSVRGEDDFFTLAAADRVLELYERWGKEAEAQSFRALRMEPPGP